MKVLRVEDEQKIASFARAGLISRGFEVEQGRTGQFSSARSFTTTASGSDSYANTAGNYNIRYKAVTGTVLTTLLASNAGKTACWTFQFTNNAGSTTQPTMSYCR